MHGGMTHTTVAVVAQDGGRMEINCQLSLGISLDRLLGRREKKQLEWVTETEREREGWRAEESERAYCGCINNE